MSIATTNWVLSIRRITVLLTGLVLAVAAALIPNSASAQRIENSVAVFAALDKVTARISKLEVDLDQTEQFGALKVTPHVCYTRSPTEPPKTTAYVDIEEIMLDGSQRRIFSGWMFAESPGLNAVEHPVFDLWLTDCATSRMARANEETQENAAAAQEGTVEVPVPTLRKRRRVQRR